MTPNYLDNSTSSVAPWCSCSGPGSQGDECSEFLGYFTHNVCLRESRPLHACVSSLKESTNSSLLFQCTRGVEWFWLVVLGYLCGVLYLVVSVFAVVLFLVITRGANVELR